MDKKKKIAFIFPGQGAQYVGMGKDFFDTFKEARETFLEADEILKMHFSRLIFEGPLEELTLTKNSQLAIFITSIAILRTVKAQFPDLKADICAGLSLGEYSALYAAGKISFKECLNLVKNRGEFMQHASEITDGTMRVVLGLTADEVEAIINPISKGMQVWVANINCPMQVVISGSVANMDKAAEILKEKGAKRVLPLKVSGAFHSGYMQSAQEKLKPLIHDVTLIDSSIELVMNVPGDFVSSPEEVRHNLIQQVTEPVRWEAGIRRMMNEGVDLFLEMGCGSTLTGMNKKIEVTGQSLFVDQVKDLDQLHELLTNAGAR